MILAAVSPVFERMFYGDFKEGKSNEVVLPKDNYITMKQLIDFIYKGSCNLDNTDSILPLIAAFDYYQINKTPFLHVCGEVILSQLDSSNYLILLPKYVSVMSEESHKKAADKVMSYTKNDFVTKFDETKDLPEEVLHALLQRGDINCHEVDIFDFLAKWHDYQTQQLGKSLKLTQQLFQSIRYQVIIPQLLSSKVADCAHADKHLLNKAYKYMHNSCSPLGKCSDDDKFFNPVSCCSRKPAHVYKIEWVVHSNVSVNQQSANTCEFSFVCKDANHWNITESLPLKNGMYTFKVYDISGHIYNVVILSVDVIGRSRKYLYTHPLKSNDVVTMSVHDDEMFLKLINADKVKSTVCISESQPFRVCICNISNISLSSNSYHSFYIHNNSDY